MLLVRPVHGWRRRLGVRDMGYDALARLDRAEASLDRALDRVTVAQAQIASVEEQLVVTMREVLKAATRLEVYRGCCVPSNRLSVIWPRNDNIGSRESLQLQVGQWH